MMTFERRRHEGFIYEKVKTWPFFLCSSIKTLACQLRRVKHAKFSKDFHLRNLGEVQTNSRGRAEIAISVMAVSREVFSAGKTLVRQLRRVKHAKFSTVFRLRRNIGEAQPHFKDQANIAISTMVVSGKVLSARASPTTRPSDSS